MTYTIEETNLERQHLLAEFLNPVSLNALSNIALPAGANILDIGCGLGDTTLMLNKRFKDSTITGLDSDAGLIEAALTEKKTLYYNLGFICGDALHLPFEDHSFDFVFTRYCLHHLVSAIDGIKEMKRVCKPGGIVFAQEPDVNFFQSYPESRAYPKFKDIVNAAFADAIVGRKLFHHFTSLQFGDIECNVQTVLATHKMPLKKFFRMTGEAMSKSIIQQNLMNEEQLEEWLNELRKIEHDENTIVLTHPIIAVWGTKN